MPSPIKRIQEMPGRYTKVTLIVKVIEPPIYHWRDDQKKDEPMEQFAPLMDELGTRMLRVPFVYAERLINGEPYKYMLKEPTTLSITVDTVSGGKETKKLRAAVPYKIDGEIQRDDRKLPIWFYPDELPEDADEVK